MGYDASVRGLSGIVLAFSKSSAVSAGPQTETYFFFLRFYQFIRHGIHLILDCTRMVEGYNKVQYSQEKPIVFLYFNNKLYSANHFL